MRPVLLFCLIGALPARPASAAEPPAPRPLCARPGVLDEVGEILHRQGRTLRLEPNPIGEVSTDPGPLVRCAVRGHIIGYDTNRYGLSPVYEPIIVTYTIELRQNGLFVHVD